MLLQDLEASLAASMSREKETMEQTAALEKEKENLARELASYINKEKEQVDLTKIIKFALILCDYRKHSYLPKG